MADDRLGLVFTQQNPLGPIAINSETDPDVLRALYDTRARLHVDSLRNPPTFLIGRRGSGKTSLLLSSRLDPSNIVIRLSTTGTFSRVQSAVTLLKHRMLLTEEGIADLWSLLLWGPIIVRLLARRQQGEPARDYQMLWEESAPLRQAASNHSTTTLAAIDDVVLDTVLQKLIAEVESNTTLRSTDVLGLEFSVVSRPWVECQRAAERIISHRRSKVYVLIDSLENIGEHIKDLEPSLRGLFHLVGRIGMSTNDRPFQLQCCFPSELWPLLDRISANPTKDFAGRLTLRWHGDDLVRAAGMRLKAFLERNYPAMATRSSDPLELLHGLLPQSIPNSLGMAEPVMAYMLRHTQLLPRQFFFILNEALHRSIADHGKPAVSAEHVLAAVREVEATLCPEIFAAHRFRYPEANDITKALVPHLRFRFSEGELHKMYNRAGIFDRFNLRYNETAEMLVRVGVLGRVTGDGHNYIDGEFDYNVDGSLVLSPHEDYCLHPLFVREYSSVDVIQPRPNTKPVYPAGTPIG